MAVFDECPRDCGNHSTFMTTTSLYECDICGEVFCSGCRMDANGRCPGCGSRDDHHDKIGVVGSD